MTLTFFAFDQILIGGLGVVKVNPCAKFGNFSFSRFLFYHADRQDMHIQRESHTYATKCLSSATAVGVSNNNNNNNLDGVNII